MRFTSSFIRIWGYKFSGLEGFIFYGKELRRLMFLQSSFYQSVYSQWYYFKATAATQLELMDESGQVANCVQFPEIC